MDYSRYGTGGARSTSTDPAGFYHGVVKAVDGDTITVQVPRLFGGAQIPNIPVVGATPSVDDSVFVSFIEGRRGALLAFPAEAAGGAAGDITAVTAGTNLNGGGTSGDVTLNLDDDISVTSVTGNLHGPVHLTVKNTSGGTLAKTTAVYATGSVGASGAVEVQVSDNSNASTMPALGLLDEELDDGEVGSATIFGVIRHVDTSGYTINDELWINGSGTLQNTRPTSGLIQKIGRVVRVHANTGEILVMGAGRTNDVPFPLFVDHANQYVGIGTTSPAEPLHVVTSSGDAYLRQDNGTATTYLGPDGSNTGLFGTSTAHDVRFITGNAEQVRIDTSGRVGIGTTTPETPLNIVTTNKLGATFTGTVDGEGVRVDQSNYTSGNYVSLIEGSYQDDQTEPHVRIAAMYDGGGSHLAFGTSNSYASGITNEAMTIDQDGRVGINNTAPGYPLEINGTLALSNESTSLISNSGDTGREILQLRARTDLTDGSGIYLYGDGDSAQAGEIIFFSDNASQMTIDGGSIGIGTTAPSSGTKLHIVDSGEAIRMERSGYDTYGFQHSAGSGIEFRNFTDGETEMYFNGSGRVGIGTTSPSQKFHVNAGTLNTTSVFESTDSVAYIGIKDNASSSDIHVAIGAVGNEMRLRANNANRVTLTGTEMTTTVPVRTADGSASAPTHSFSSDTNTGVYRVASDRLGFTTGGAARMYIQNSSTGLSGSGTRAFSVKGSGAHEMYRTSTSATDGILALYSNHGSTADLQWLVYGDGDTASDTGVYGTISDNRLKTNIIQYHDPTDDLMAINVIKYDLSKTSTGVDENGDPIIVDREESKTMTGWEAQQVQSVKPGFVKLDSERGILSVKSSVFVPLLHRGFQVHEEKIQALQAENAELLARIEALEAE